MQGLITLLSLEVSLIIKSKSMKLLIKEIESIKIEAECNLQRAVEHNNKEEKAYNEGIIDACDEILELI